MSEFFHLTWCIKVDSCCSINWYLISFCDSIITHWMNRPHFVYPFFSCWRFTFWLSKIFMNVCVQIFVWIYVFNFLGYIPRSKIAESYDQFTVNFLRNCFFKVAALLYIPNSNVEEIQFFHILANTYYYLTSDDCHPSGCEVVSNCGFDLYFSNDKWCWTSVHVIVRDLYI